MKRFILSIFCGLALAVGAHAQVDLAPGASGSGVAVHSGQPTAITMTTYTVQPSDTYVTVNAAGSCTLTLPVPPLAGRVLFVRTIAAQTVVSASSNVVPVAGGSAATAILAGTAGKWAILVYDATNAVWQVVAAN